MQEHKPSQDPKKESEENTPPIAFPNILQAVGLLFALLFIQIALVFMMSALGIEFGNGDNFIGVFVTLLSCAAIVLWSIQRMQISWIQLFTPTEKSNSLLSMVIVLGGPLILVCAGGMYWIAELTNIFVTFFPPSVEEIELLTNMIDGSFWSLVAVCLVAPLVEEVIFRGIILRGFLQHYSINHAILLSSLVFALFHMTILQLPTAFILGCLFAWLYVKTRSLWPSIIAHFINNSLAMIIFYASDKPEYSPELTEPVFSSPIETIFALCVSAYGMFLLDKILRPKPYTEK